MFSDIVGYSTLMAGNEAGAMATLERCSRLHRDTVAAHGGRVLKELGDGFLASFDSVSAAIAAAREIQAAARGEGSFQLRIGIHLGEVAEIGGDVLGDGVNIASRIQAAAEPGTIVASETVYNNVRNKEGVVTSDLGSRELKGLEEPVRLYSIEV
jgi:class 3 adenylate cyclase